MIVLISGGPDRNRDGEALVGRLISPRSRTAIGDGEVWAADNDAFLAWDEGRFRQMLARFAWTPGCLFVAVPDVVGDARATLNRFDEWRGAIEAVGLPTALVGQDGAEDLAIPWNNFDAWFIGGSTEWKLSPASFDLAREAKARGKWVHMGRVNTQKRLRIASDFGCDSIDGTGWSKFADHYFKRDIPFLKQLNEQPILF